MERVIQASQISKRVTTQGGELTILSAIDFDVKPSSTAAIIGPSGSGKSTLLAILATLDSPTSGHLKLNGQEMSHLNGEQKAAFRKENTAFVFQNFMLVDTLTALENVMLPLQLSGAVDAKEKAARWLERVGLQHRHDHVPTQLSGGEQQRVALARAFVTEPAILFADEPSGNLDPKNGEKVADLLFELNQHAKTSLVLVTHDHQLAHRCDAVWQMVDGQLSKIKG